MKYLIDQFNAHPFINGYILLTISLGFALSSASLYYWKHHFLEGITPADEYGKRTYAPKSTIAWILFPVSAFFGSTELCFHPVCFVTTSTREKIYMLLATPFWPFKVIWPLLVYGMIGIGYLLGCACSSLDQTYHTLTNPVPARAPAPIRRSLTLAGKRNKH